MRRNAIRVLALAVSAAIVVPLVTATDVEASSRHTQKHHARLHHGFSNAWASEVRPVAAPLSWGGDVCPGAARSFDCRIWPPPFADDPDRKNGFDGGG